MSVYECGERCCQAKLDVAENGRKLGLSHFENSNLEGFCSGFMGVMSGYNCGNQ